MARLQASIHLVTRPYGVPNGCSRTRIPRPPKGSAAPRIWIGSIIRTRTVGKTLLDILLRPQSWSLSRVPFCLERGKPSRDRRNRKARHVRGSRSGARVPSGAAYPPNCISTEYLNNQVCCGLPHRCGTRAHEHWSLDIAHHSNGECRTSRVFREVCPERSRRVRCQPLAPWSF